MLKKLFLLSIVVNIILIGIFVKSNYFQKQTVSEVNINNPQTLYSRYPLLSKRVLLEFKQDILINFLGLRKEMNDQLSPYGDTFGVYFEYLPTGSSINVNGSLEFNAASLFKLPVVMAYVRSQERLGLTNDPEVTIQPSQIDKEFGDLWKKGAGYKIKMSDAIRLALENSDNTAAKVIADNVTDDDFAQVYQNLDISLQTDNKGAILTAKNYTSVLKALYFSSVLDRGDSEKILELLTKTKFSDKLVSGVPFGIKVAHKIGNFIDTKDKMEAFTDCGIVYIPKRPYALCMVSKTDANIARERMQLLSKTIYDFVSLR